MIDDRVRDLLDDLLDDEPPLPDTAVAVFGLADKLRKRRRRRILIGATGLVLLVAFAGNAVTELIGPTVRAGLTGGARPSPAPTPAPLVSASAAPPTAAPDPVHALAVRALGVRGYVLRPDERGDGWRRYTVREGSTVVGSLEVVVYSTATDLCLPPTAEPSDDCVRMVKRNGVSYWTYEGPDDEFTEVVSIRDSDARAFAVHAVGVQPTGGGDPVSPLTVTELKRIALESTVPDAFGDGEWCERPDPSCPALGVPVPPESAD